MREQGYKLVHTSIGFSAVVGGGECSTGFSSGNCLFEPVLGGRPVTALAFVVFWQVVLKARINFIAVNGGVDVFEVQ